MLIDGKIALVTGGSRGIGRQIVETFLENGAVVHSFSRSAGDDLPRMQETYGSDRLVHHAVDVGDEEAVSAAVARVLEQSGRVDILVNNAGITRDGLMMRMKTDDWQSVLDLNLGGVFLCSRAVIRPMLKQRSGRIINITSVVGLIGNAGQANYAAAKAGVIGLTRSTARELASRGITVNAVAPGFIATDMTKDLDAEAILKNIPLGRFGTQDQVAGAVRFLAADPAASYITGQVLQVDGGMVMA